MGEDLSKIEHGKNKGEEKSARMFQKIKNPDTISWCSEVSYKLNLK
jgi:hypothetical protein